MLQALPIVWRVVANLIVVGMALAVLAFPTSDFEKLVVALLVLIFVSVLSWSTWLVRTVRKSEAANVHRFVALLRNQYRDDVFADAEEPELWASVRGTGKHLIGIVANAIIAIAALSQVIDVLT